MPTKADLERDLIADLVNQGYEHLPKLTTPKKMLENVRVQLQSLNKMEFSDDEWKRFCEEYPDKPSDSHIDKTRKIHNDYIDDFVFDDGHIQNIYLMDKKDIVKNKLQIISQFEQTSARANRYDVTISVNGLPLVQVELKKRGMPSKKRLIIKYLQLSVTSNGADSRYFANTTKRDKNSFDFTTNWAKSDNVPIKDLKDFTATFFQKKHITKCTSALFCF